MSLPWAKFTRYNSKVKTKWLVIIAFIIISQYLISSGKNKKQSMVPLNEVVQLNQHIVEEEAQKRYLEDDNDDHDYTPNVISEKHGYFDDIIFWNEQALQTVPEGKIV